MDKPQTAMAVIGAEAESKAWFRLLRVRYRASWLVLGLGIGLSACDAAREESGTGHPVGTELGQQAPRLTGTRGDGRSYRFAPARGEVSAIVFYRSFHCGLCRERLRELQARQAEYERAGARVLAVTPDKPADVERAVAELRLHFPVISVDTATLTRWGVLEAGRTLPLPASYLVDPRGYVLYRHVGRNAADRASDIEMLAVLQQLGS